jgi:hypothetical protein
MGGRGSTRWGEHSKARTVEQCLILDARMLTGLAIGERIRGRVRVGARRPIGSCDLAFEVGFPSGGPRLVIAQPEDPDRPAVAVQLTVRDMPFGGMRWYLHCPGCGDRVSKLYWPLIGPSRGLGCRSCHGLAYLSSQSHRTWLEPILRGDWDPAKKQISLIRARLDMPIGEADCSR